MEEVRAAGVARSADLTKSVQLHGRALVLGVVTVGLILRLEDFFGWWLNPDEGIYFSTVTQPSRQAFWAEVGSQAHPPLYFLILRWVGYLTLDFAALRFLALASGVGAIYLLVLVGRELACLDTDTSRSEHAVVTPMMVGLTSGLLLALSPRAVTQSQVIRPYMFLALTLSAALFFLLRYLRQPRPLLLVGYGVFATLAVLTHYSALLALGVFGLLVTVDGVRRGFARREWWRLLAVQAAPATAVLLLYLMHLRTLMGLATAENAQQGWLGSYMIRAPGDLWLSIMSFHSMLSGEFLAPGAALLSLWGLVLATRQRAWTTVTLGLGGLMIAGGAAAAQLYPFGATRHTSWLLVFVIPVLAWTLVLTMSRGASRARAFGALLAPIAFSAAGLMGYLGMNRLPPEISERVLQLGHLEAMEEVLDPQAPPGVIFMSTETFQLLTPLYAKERESARRSGDGVLLHFVWGSRDVVVLPSRDFTVLPQQIGYPNHLFTAVRTVSMEFPSIGLSEADTILVLAGGWRSQGMADLVEMAGDTEPLGSATGVPGLIAVELDVAAYSKALLAARRPGQQ